jgi:hypothetical protein
MKIVIRSFITFCLLNASIDAFSSPFQQPADGLVKGTSGITGYSVYASKDAPAVFTKDTTSFNTGIDTSFYRINTTYKAALVRLKQQAAAIKNYVAENNFNTEYCFLVDMSIPDGKNRFFVYNLDKDAPEISSLVSHGFGSTKQNSYAELEFSNEPNSFKTSLGRYRIGDPYKGTYGLSYKLYGLDSTNDRAFERTIVLHADTHVPEREVFPYHIYQSAGCPTVSPLFLQVLSKYIRASKKPILMWIYYS